MTAPVPSPCSWPVDRECLPAVDGAAEQASRDAAEDMAVEVLWRLSGRQFGVCPVIIRPCPTSCGTGGSASFGWYPVLDGGIWRNIPCGCTGDCRRSGPTVVHLPGPVQSIVAVTINGVLQNSVDYRLEGDLLYRVGGAIWPDQNLQAPLDEPGTWSIEYMRGTPVPAGVGVLVGKLALEFYSACQGGKCRLPATVRSVSRNGVTYQVADPGAVYDRGYTGITEIDLWLASVNPNKLQRRASVR